MEKEISEEKKQSVEDKISIRLRKAGRIALRDHANGKKESFDFLSDEEKKFLAVLLKKCLNAWKTDEK